MAELPPPITTEFVGTGLAPNSKDDKTIDRARSNSSAASGSGERDKHVDAAIQGPNSGDLNMTDLFYVGLIVAVFVVSALFIPLLRRS
jgi:hypothetical protein